MSTAPLASLSLTHVNYNPSDPISYVSAWLALLPQGLCIVYVTLFLTNREIEIALAFAGQLACEVLNFGLKRLIKEQRPEKFRALGKGYGMPSSHAQFVAFWSVYVSLWLWLRFSPRRIVEKSDAWSSVWPEGDSKRTSEAGLGVGKSLSTPKPKHKKSKSDSSLSVVPPSPDTTLGVEGEVNGDSGSPLSPDVQSDLPLSPAYALQLQHPHLTKLFLSVMLLSLAGLVCVSRIYLEYHTPRQVWVGIMTGAAFATLWFVTVEIARRMGYIDQILDLHFLRGLRIRDLACEEDLVELGWTLWEQKRKLKKQKRRKSVRFAGLPDEAKAMQKSRKEKVAKDDKEKKKKKI